MTRDEYNEAIGTAERILQECLESGVPGDEERSHLERIVQDLSYTVVIAEEEAG